jgi:hypothetical protein
VVRCHACGGHYPTAAPPPPPVICSSSPWTTIVRGALALLP